MSIYKSVLRHYVGTQRANEILSRGKNKLIQNHSDISKKKIPADRPGGKLYAHIPSKKEVIAAVIKAEPLGSELNQEEEFNFIGQFKGTNPKLNEIRYIGELENYPPTRLLIDIELSNTTEGKPIAVQALFDSGCDFQLVLSPSMCKQLNAVTVVDQATVVTADSVSSDHKVVMVYLTVGGYRFLTEACIMDTDEPYIGNFVLKYFEVIFKDDQFVLIPRADKIAALQRVEKKN